jgi:hypothetical protein
MANFFETSNPKRQRKSILSRLVYELRRTQYRSKPHGAEEDEALLLHRGMVRWLSIQPMSTTGCLDLPIPAKRFAPWLPNA